MLVRKPLDTDYPQIYALLERAFAPSISEAELVRSLKNRGTISFDFVIDAGGRVRAYACYSAAYDDAGKRTGYHLAPVAVLPEKQRQGLGQRILRESLKIVGRPVYVLGDPGYYRRFGFNADKSQKSRFDPDGRHFLTLADAPLPPQDVGYEDAFYEL